jgi:hypothetical protein
LKSLLKKDAGMVAVAKDVERVAVRMRLATGFTKGTPKRGQLLQVSPAIQKSEKRPAGLLLISDKS